MLVVRRVLMCLGMVVSGLGWTSSQASGASSPPITLQPGGLTKFQPIAPTRMLDTRTGNGAPAVKVGPGQTVTVQIAGRGGVPTSGAAAVSVNLTVTQPSTASYVTVWPAGQSRPKASILNFGGGQTIANSTVVGLSSSGKISLFNSSGSTHLLADVSGWFPVGGTFNAIAPARLLDTRTGNGAAAIKVGPGESISVQIAGRGGIPATGVSAVSVNLTATAETRSGYLTAWPTGWTRTTASILNFRASTSIANSAVVGLGSGGQLSLFNSSGSTHLIVDVSGWFPFGGSFVEMAPERLLDTRTGIGADPVQVGPGETVTVQIWGRGGIPDGGVSAVSVNVTATTETENGFLTAWPSDQTRPRVSTLNFRAGQTVANSTIVGLSPSGQISIYNSSGFTNILADISGYFYSEFFFTEQIEPGTSSTCALNSRGYVKCWGYNDAGQLGVRSRDDSSTPLSVVDLSRVVQITSGTAFHCALLETGAAKCWGANEEGQLGDGTTTDATAPVSVVGLSNAVWLDAGDQHACAVLSDGTAQCWGRNEEGQLGDGSLVRRTQPVQVSGLSGVSSITAGGGHSCALHGSGGLSCWGRGVDGQLGDDAFSNETTPVSVANISTAIQVSAGTYHTCAALADGAAQCWGNNEVGQLGDGTNLASGAPADVVGIGNAVSLAGGLWHSCALLDNGQVRCWGEGTWGALGDGLETDSNEPVAVANVWNSTYLACGERACTMIDSGVPKFWGDLPNSWSETGSSTTPVNVIGLYR